MPNFHRKESAAAEVNKIITAGLHAALLDLLYVLEWASCSTFLNSASSHSIATAPSLTGKVEFWARSGPFSPDTVRRLTMPKSCGSMENSSSKPKPANTFLIERCCAKWCEVSEIKWDFSQLQPSRMRCRIHARIGNLSRTALPRCIN